MKKSIFAIILCVMMLVSFASVMAMAEDTESTEVLTLPAEMESAVPENDTQSSEELLTAYAQHELDVLAGEVSAAGSLGANLTGANAVLYRENKAQIARIAAGERCSTEIAVDSAALFGKTSFTAAELGGMELVVNGTINSRAIDAITEQVNAGLVVQMLMQDCPYELYWFDKTYGYSYGLSGSYSVMGDVLTIPESYVIAYCVSGDCAPGHVEGGTETDPSLGQQVQGALTNIRAVVGSAAGLDDWAKLNRYKQEICDRVSYNDSAARGGYTYNYGNPWQLIWVFDNDSATTVVCEGYAKAFQYLCDLSNFTGVTCYTVHGDMVTERSGGGHMWNIVRMPNGKNYLVDITNCDDSSIGSPDLLFMKGYSAKNGDCISRDLSYSFSCNGSVVDYSYDDEMFTLFSADDLTLSAADYDPTASAGVTIDALSFPDANFRSFVSENYDADQNGFLSVTEIEAARYMNITNRNIEVLTGLSCFTALDSLYCGGNRLTSIDVSGNASLVILDCSNNQLSGLALGANKALKSLYCGGNPLTTLDLRANTSLEELRCGNCKLTSIDISTDTALTELSCERNELTSLDLSNHQALKKLNCANNSLDRLVLGSKPQLMTCDVTANPLELVDISGCPILVDLVETGSQEEESDTRRYLKYLNEFACDKTQLLQTAPDQQFSIFYLPSSLTEIGEEAFAGGTADKIVLPDGCRSVAARAFADCPKLQIVSAPAGTVIDADAFQGSEQVYLQRRAG